MQKISEKYICKIHKFYNFYLVTLFEFSPFRLYYRYRQKYMHPLTSYKILSGTFTKK